MPSQLAFVRHALNPLAFAHQRLELYRRLATPSTSISPEPIIQSTWIRLAFAPSAANCSASIFSPPIRHVE